MLYFAVPCDRLTWLRNGERVLSKLFCGVDFGTTNSSAAVSDGNRTWVLELDPLNDSPTSLPSLLYFTREGEQIVGRAAANAFIERNVDREIILRQVDLGIDIAGYVGSEPDKSDTYRPPDLDIEQATETVRARAMIEVNSPGRLFQSLKTLLRFRGFRSTEVFGEQYQIEQLTAIILRRIKEAVDRVAGESIERAVLGRPVSFSRDAAEDELAAHRLMVAANLAGFEEVSFFYEPVAACVEYAVKNDTRQRLMVVDIGGGTCDVCVMEFGGARGAAERLAESRILGVAGVPVAGDVIDREIIRERLFPLFGSRSRYGPSQLPVPQFLFNQILDWQNLYKLNTEETIYWLIAMEMSSTEPEAIRALRCLVQRNYGYPIAREVEAAKKRLSAEPDTHIRIDHEYIHIDEYLERASFAHIIEHSMEHMLTSIKEAESAAQVRPRDIDYVLTTGGTSLVPAISQMIRDRYGAERVIQRETFTSVAAGLAIVAQYT